MGHVGFWQIDSEIVFYNWINNMKKPLIIPTPIKAIRKKCLDCTNGQYDEIRNCSVKKCALYPYRMGKRPNQATIDTLNENFSEN